MSTGKHRRSGPPKLLAYHVLFRPRHCGGTSCMHTHADGGPFPTPRRADEGLLPSQLRQGGAS